MKSSLALALLLLASATSAVAQQADGTKRSAKSSGTTSREQLHSGAKQVAAGISAAEHALTPEQLSIAEQIHEGRIACELGSYVQITADTRNPGYFNVQTKAQRYRMYPVVTATGAIRLEDQKVGAVWLQLANKSMLMNQKLGQRVADECMSPAQHAVAQALAAKPAPSLFEPATPPQQATAPAADGNTSVVYNK